MSTSMQVSNGVFLPANTQDVICSTSLNGMFINARSLRANEKMDKIKVCLDELRNIDVVCIVETWLEEKETKFFSMEGFVAFHHTRKGQRGGGVTFYINNNINIISCEYYGEYVQMVHVKARIKSQLWNLIGVYNPSTESIIECTDSLDDILIKIGNSQTIIMGDFNMDIGKPTVKSDQYISKLSMRGYTIMNNEITRPDSGTVIDHIITNCLTGSMEVFTIPNDISDHNTVIWRLKNKDMQGNPRKEYEIRKMDYVKLGSLVKKELEECDLDENVDEISKIIHGSIEANLNKAVTTRVVKRGYTKLNPWATKELADLSTQKLTLCKKMKKHPLNNLFKQEYKKVNKKINDLRHKLKSEYNQTKLEESICKGDSVWKIMKVVAGVTRGLDNKIMNIKYKEQIYNEASDIAEALNDFYVSIGPKLSENIPQVKHGYGSLEDYTISSNTEMELKEVNEAEITEIIKKLSNKHSSPNGISNILVKQIASVITQAVTKMVNRSFEDGIFPEKCKETVVIPIFKTGDREDPGNYRPISILSGISRIMEYAMKPRLEAFLNGINFFYHRQYGFSEKRDANGAIFDLVTRIQSALDRNKMIASIFIDLKKAFDTVDHAILIEKLSKCGIRNNGLKWFKSYLSNRTQRVRLGNIVSPAQYIQCGVPQGSILGPILFTIYINDIGLLPLKGKIQLFADDAVLIYEGQDELKLKEDMIYDMKLLEVWFTVNKLTLNYKKTNYIIFTKPAAPDIDLRLQIGINIIERVKTAKYLGIYLDEHLNWEMQVKEVLPQLRAANRLMFRIRKDIPPVYLKMLYYAYFHSTMSYMCMTWGLGNQLLVNKIRVLQNSIIKNMLRLPRRTNTKFIYEKSQILPFDAIVNTQLASVVHNHIHGKKFLNSNIITIGQIHSYNVRNSCNLQLPVVHSTYYGLRSVYYNAVSCYNQLPQIIKDNTAPSRKRLIKSFFQQKVFAT